MRRLLLLATVLIAARAEAATPSGCYATYSNPDFCYGGEIDTYYQNDNDNIVQYGITVGALVNDLKYMLASFNNCAASNDQNIKDYNTLVYDYNTLVDTNKALKKSIKTLKRKCGSRCR